MEHVMIISAIIFGVIAYLIGSLSSAILICKAFKLPDPRTQGSMNPGATNVLRIGGRLPAALTLVSDLLKGYLPVLIAHLFGVEGFALSLVALLAFLGHLYPLFFRFQGGKGVATAAGAILALAPMVGLAAILIWLLTAIIFRYSSLAALLAVITTPVLMLLFSDSAYLLPTLIITVGLVWKHWGNIQRLRFGEESKIKL
jgi:glycerol-3-phosphate acyltransferase PlsY